MGKMTVEEALKLAQSPQGKELLSAIQGAMPEKAAKAEKLAMQGDRKAAEEILKNAANDPNIQEILKKITL